MSFLRAVVALWLLAFGLTSACPAQQYQNQVDVNWDFTTATSSLGWTGGGLTSFGINNAALVFTANSQTYWIRSPLISVSTAPLQLVEIVMSCNTAGAAAVYWAPAQNNFGNFPGINNFPMLGDSAFHTYFLPIDTSSASTIYQLGLTVPPGATVSIQSVALANMVAPPAGSGVAPNWQFTSDSNALGWMLYSGVVDMSVSGGRLNLQTYSNVTLLAPAAQVSNQLEWFSLFGRVTQTSLQTPWAKFGYLSSANGGNTENVYIPLTPDSVDHVYNENVGGALGWWASVSQLSITISENTTIALSQIEISAAPQGPADIVLDACASMTPMIRAGSPFQFSCRVSNRGSQPAQNLSSSLTLPSDGNVTTSSSPTAPASLVNGYPQTLVWTLVASQAASEPISVSVASQNGGSAEVSTSVLVSPAVPLQVSSYVPVPVPAYSDYDVGIFYFPGWSLYSHWDPDSRFSRAPAVAWLLRGG
jgi:hypothetical protein